VKCAFAPRCPHEVEACSSPGLDLLPDPERPDHLVRCADPAPVPGRGTSLAPDVDGGTTTQELR